MSGNSPRIAVLLHILHPSWLYCTCLLHWNGKMGATTRPIQQVGWKMAPRKTRSTSLI